MDSNILEKSILIVPHPISIVNVMFSTKQMGRNPIKPAGALELLTAIEKAITAETCNISTLDLTVCRLRITQICFYVASRVSSHSNWFTLFRAGAFRI